MWQDFKQQDVKTGDLFGSPVLSVSNEYLWVYCYKNWEQISAL